jgi:hypothetical protein
MREGIGEIELGIDIPLALFVFPYPLFDVFRVVNRLGLRSEQQDVD